MQWNLVCIGSVAAVAAAIWELIEREEERGQGEKQRRDERGRACLRLVGEERGRGEGREI